MSPSCEFPSKRGLDCIPSARGRRRRRRRHKSSHSPRLPTFHLAATLLANEPKWHSRGLQFGDHRHGKHASRDNSLAAPAPGKNNTPAIGARKTDR